MLMKEIAIVFSIILIFTLVLPGYATRLISAIQNSDHQRVMELLDNGADVNECENEGPTPLMWAANKGQSGVVNVLLERGADINKTSGFYGSTALMYGVTSGRVEIIKILLEHGAQVDQKDSKGWTALMKAADGGKAMIVKILLDYGADSGAEADGQTALILAKTKNHASIVKLFERAETKEAPTHPDYSKTGIDDEKIKRMMEEAVKKATQSKPAEVQAKPTLSSDVDKPKYKQAENSDNFALVVGVEKYSNNLPEAQFPERDAQTVKDHLIALGVPARQIKCLIGNQATTASFKAYLEEWLSRNVKENSRVFFYYSGHGAPDPKSNQAYLVLYDGNPEFLGTTGYPIKTLYSQLNLLKAKEIIVALDSCFSGSGGRSVLAQGTRPLVTKIEEEMPATNKLVVFSASAGNEISGTLDEQGHGAFTYYFLKGLNGEGKDNSGQITVKSLYSYLKPKVQDAASLNNRDQTPQLMPDVATNIQLR